MTESYLAGGLDPKKYIVTKSNGEPNDARAEYFVLRVDADPHAAYALSCYAQSVQEDNKKLAADIFNWCARLSCFLTPAEKAFCEEEEGDDHHPTPGTAHGEKE